MCKRVLAAVLGIVAAGAAQTAVAQTSYPNRPVSVIVPFAAGGPTDVVARIVGEHMSRTLGQQLVIENVGGAGGTTGMTRVAQAAPDGYTLGVGNMGTQSAAPALYPASSTTRQRALPKSVCAISRRKRSWPRRAWPPGT